MSCLNGMMLVHFGQKSFRVDSLDITHSISLCILTYAITALKSE